MQHERTIRRLIATDLDALLTIYTHLHTQDAPATATRLNQVWQQIMADPAQIYVGAFVDNQLASACHATLIPNLTRGARPYALIENVVTHPDFRRQGLSTQTLQALIDICWAQDCYKIMLLSGAQRGAAHNLYAALGFDGSSKRGYILKPNT